MVSVRCYPQFDDLIALAVLIIFLKCIISNKNCCPSTVVVIESKNLKHFHNTYWLRDVGRNSYEGQIPRVTRQNYVVHQSGVYPGFSGMKRPGVFPFPPGRDASPLQGYPQFASTYLYTWVERGTVRVKSIAQQHNTMLPAKTRAVVSETFNYIHPTRFLQKSNFLTTLIRFQVLNSVSFTLIKGLQLSVCQ